MLKGDKTPLVDSQPDILMKLLSKELINTNIILGNRNRMKDRVNSSFNKSLAL